MIYKDSGITIKYINFQEYDRIISVITKNHGKVSAVAKGVRKLHSRKSSSCDLFVESKFCFAKGKNLDVLTEAEVVDPYEDLKCDYDSTIFLFYVSELLDYFVQEEDNEYSVSYYILLKQFLSSSLLGCSIEKSVRIFETKMLHMAGLMPELFSCSNCRRPLPPDNNAFDFRSGGILCKKCSSNKNYMRLNLNTIKALRFLTLNDLSIGVKLSADSSVYNEIKFFNMFLIENVLGISIKSKSFT